MAKLDLTRKPTPKQTERALATYNESAKSQLTDYFCYLIGRGVPAWKAYSAIHPEASEKTAKREANRMLCHPTIRENALRQQIGLRALAMASAPTHLVELDRLAREGKTAERVRLDAVNSFLDRSGLPRGAEILVGAVTVALEDLQRSPGAIIDAETVDVDQPDSLPLSADDRTSTGPSEDQRVEGLEQDRVSLRSMLPAGVKI